MKPFLRRHALVLGIALMFLLTWPIDFANAGLLPWKLPAGISLLFGWGLGIAALVMTGLSLGKEAVIGLLKRFLMWRVEAKWYLIALLLYPSIFLGAVLLKAAWTQTSPDYSHVMAQQIFGASANMPVFILPFFLVDLLTNGEELGWRGYVLPRLQARHSALVSSLIVGLLWGFWHFPRYLAPENTGALPFMMVKSLADAVIYTWLYNSTRGSLLLTSLLHSAGNTAGVFLPMANTLSGANMDAYVTAIVLLMIVAAVISSRMRPGQLQQTEWIQVQQ